MNSKEVLMRVVVMTSAAAAVGFVAAAGRKTGKS
jgi:hypothetical protein